MPSFKNSSHGMVVTIDGPAGAGKSTVAKEVAKRLGFTYLDTGAMYRSLTLKALTQKINLEDENALIQLLQKTHIDLVLSAEHQLRVLLDGEDVSDAIRTPEVTKQTFHIASHPGVRSIMVERQRQIGAKSYIVAEGRDIGTVVFPEAQKKIYLDADFTERANRRTKELNEKGKPVISQEVQKDLQERDHKDFTRKVGPLKKADDAVVVDTTHLSIEEVVRRIMEIVQPHG